MQEKTSRIQHFHLVSIYNLSNVKRIGAAQVVEYRGLSVFFMEAALKHEVATNL